MRCRFAPTKHSPALPEVRLADAPERLLEVTLSRPDPLKLVVAHLAHPVAVVPRPLVPHMADRRVRPAEPWRRGVRAPLIGVRLHVLSRRQQYEAVDQLGPRQPPAPYRCLWGHGRTAC